MILMKNGGEDSGVDRSSWREKHGIGGGGGERLGSRRAREVSLGRNSLGLGGCRRCRKIVEEQELLTAVPCSQRS